MKLSGKQQFLIVFAAFCILGIPFKVMTLIDGFTEVRPVNALPPVAGLVCGPIGALGCGIGNLVSDVFGTWNGASWIGFISNMLAAYLPYRLWHIYSDEMPNVHTLKNILKYIAICYTAALVVAWSLGLGMHYFLGQWIEEMYTYVFFNNFGFSVVLGLPLLILLTAKDINVQCTPRPKHYFLLKNERTRKIFPVLYTIVMSFFLIAISFFHISPAGQPVFLVLSVVGIFGLIPLIF